ncbi:deleted in malignant brain tumors 1 protein-like [Mytilus trossulus]|uniref:deleted in malignant brain tumors 1 protein-like n=1 Tax=Mytilus trossulus TaxID=6551 RepID=UPI003007000C
MLACERTLVEGLTCLNCDSVMNPLFCDHTIECMSGSICSIEKFESSGNILYKLGCLSRTRCPRTRSLAHTDIEQCIECCTTDGCNKDGCGITNHLQTGPLCFNCDGIADPMQCHQTRVCEADEMCYIQEMMRFNQRFFKTSCENMHVCQALSGYVPAFGRKKRAAIIQKRSTLCSKCCQSDLCNDYCTTTTSTTSTTPATTLVHGCGGNFSSMSGSLSSPWFPDPYPNLSSCKYYIDVPVGYKIHLTVNTFKTEGSLDYLKVYDGLTTSNNTLAELSGTYRNNTENITSTNNEMLLHFTSDVSVVYYGFRVSYKAFNHSGSRFLTSSTGSFSSPNYPHPYTDYLYCTYLIRVQSGQRINLAFTSIITEGNYDYLQAFDGSRVSDRRLLNFSGSINNTMIIQSTGNVILVLFTTDGSHTERGFTATYTSHS